MPARMPAWRWRTRSSWPSSHVDRGMGTESQRSAAREIVAKETSCGSVPLKGRGLFLSFVDWFGFLLFWNTVPVFRGRAPVSR